MFEQGHKIIFYSAGSYNNFISGNFHIFQNPLVYFLGEDTRDLLEFMKAHEEDFGTARIIIPAIERDKLTTQTSLKKGSISLNECKGTTEVGKIWLYFFLEYF